MKHYITINKRYHTVSTKLRLIAFCAFSIARQRVGPQAECQLLPKSVSEGCNLTIVVCHEALRSPACGILLLWLQITIEQSTVEFQYLEHRWLVYHGKLNSCKSLRNSSDSSRNETFVEIFLFYHEIVCCCSLESPQSHHWDDFNELQHTIIVKKIEKNSLNYRYLLPGLALWLIISGSN